MQPTVTPSHACRMPFVEAGVVTGIGSLPLTSITSAIRSGEFAPAFPFGLICLNFQNGRNMPSNATLRIKSSSSTIATKFVLLCINIVQNLAAPSNLHNHTLVCERSYRPEARGSAAVASRRLPLAARLHSVNCIGGYDTLPETSVLLLKAGQEETEMNGDYVFLCGVMWCRFGQEEAGKELLRAATSTDPDTRALAWAMLAEGRAPLEGFVKTGTN